MIVKRKKGYYVLSVPTLSRQSRGSAILRQSKIGKKTRKNLGGPYKTRAEAVKRLGQVEFFKHRKQSLSYLLHLWIAWGKMESTYE